MTAAILVLPEAHVFDIRRMVQTSGLLGPQFKPLASMPAILEEIASQGAEKAKGELVVVHVLHGKIPEDVSNFRRENQDLLLNDLARRVQTKVTDDQSSTKIKVPLPSQPKSRTSSSGRPPRP